MKVSSLQQYMLSLVAPLQSSGAAAKVTTDLEQTSHDLQPFAEMEVWQLAELLRQAREYRDTGVLPAPAKKRAAGGPRASKPKGDPAVVLDYAQKVRALEERAAAPESTREELAEGLEKLSLGKLTKDVLVGIAKELSRPVNGRTTKPQAIDQIRRVVLERKEMLESAIT